MKKVIAIIFLFISCGYFNNPFLTSDLSETNENKSPSIITWQKMLGGSSSDRPYSMQQTSDGGYIVAGVSSSTDIEGVTNHGGEDYYIIKLDSNGNIIWQKMYGGSSSDQAWSIKQTNDGCYIVIGISSSSDISGLTNHGNWDSYIIKLDSNGDIVWQKMYGGNWDDWCSSIQQTSDGGYIVAGVSGSTNISGLTNHGLEDYYIIKLDSNGNIVWQKMYGGSEFEGFLSLLQTSDGGYVVAGWSRSTNISGVTFHGGADWYIIKLNSNGNIVWQKMYGGVHYENITTIQQTSDGGYIAIGVFYILNISLGSYDYCIIKLDSNGNIVWQKLYGGSRDDRPITMQKTIDGGYIVAGVSASTDIIGLTNHGGDDYYIIKLDSNGNIIWQKMYGGSDTEKSCFIVQTSGGNYIVTGTSSSTDMNDLINHGSTDYYISILDSSGNITWEKMFGGSDSDDSISLQQSIDGYYILAGRSKSINISGVTNHGNEDYYILELDINNKL